MQAFKSYLLVLVLWFTLVINGLAQDAQADTAFFSKVHLGMTIDEAEKLFRGLDVTIFWHSDAPAGQERIEFRTATSPQRRVYVHYSQADKKIVSVECEKLGEGETFSKAERNHLVKLNGDPAELKVTLLDDGSSLEITTPKQFKIEAVSYQ